MDAPSPQATIRAASSAEVFRAFLKLGLTSFGGPIAHLGYFRDEFVVRRRWIDERGYADLVALCQFLPGPASSQVGLGIGLIKAGVAGALAAWAGFTLPSALVMLAFAYGVESYWEALGSGWLHGLKVVAVAVVAQAVWGMARTLCPDRERFTLAAAATLLVLAVPTALGQIGAILGGGLAGWLLLKPPETRGHVEMPVPVSRGFAAVNLVAFFLLLGGLPLLAAATGTPALAIFDGFYRTGSLVFGGGHVMLPLLQSVVVPPGWVTTDEFLAGYGAAQAIPGPLFTFAAYLGTLMEPLGGGWPGGILCLLAIFLPSFLLVFGVMPFWDRLRRVQGIQSALMGVNAAVVGLLLAALYHPVWTSAIRSPGNFGLGLVAFALLVFWKWPPWLVVLLTALGGGAVVATGG
ncbi:MAG: chromate transporter [Burkholderiales bacterium]|nr:MAG: chromate transporter [Burkholderiales bacterium]